MDTGSFDLVMPWLILILLPLPIIIDKVTLDKFTDKAEKDSGAHYDEEETSPLKDDGKSDAGSQKYSLHT